jgi:glycine oxidase
VNADVIVTGQGVIGLCAALAVAERNLRVLVVGQPGSGEASRAAAGMLAPSVERASADADTFGIAARDRYPAFLEYLCERSRVNVSLNRSGILQVALSAAGEKGLRKSAAPTSAWLDRDELARIEPALSHALGAVYNPLDGCVDNVALMDALLDAAASDHRVALHAGRVVNIQAAGGSITAALASGDSVSASSIVISAGAWSGQIGGARLASSVSPAKGQLVRYPLAPLSHVIYGPRGYLVPRGSATIAGSTMERTGFDAATSAEGSVKIRRAASEILPPLAALEPESAWAGLRPVTPDMLPLIGADPEQPEIIYACGHGRNGILMAPLTGDLVADLLTASPLPHDLAQFRPDRF